jgi:hypothetical protein
MARNKGGFEPSPNLGEGDTIVRGEDGKEFEDALLGQNLQRASSGKSQPQLIYYLLMRIVQNVFDEFVEH